MQFSYAIVVFVKSMIDLLLCKYMYNPFRQEVMIVESLLLS